MSSRPSPFWIPRRGIWGHVVRALAADPPALRAIADALAEGEPVKMNGAQAIDGVQVVEVRNGAVPV